MFVAHKRIEIAPLEKKLVCSNNYQSNLNKDIVYNSENWLLDNEKYDNYTPMDNSNINFFQHKKHNYDLIKNDDKIKKYIETKAKPNTILFNDYKRYSENLNLGDEKHLNSNIYHLGNNKDIEKAHYDYLEKVNNMNKNIYEDLDENMYLLSHNINYGKYYNPEGYEKFNYNM